MKRMLPVLFLCLWSLSLVGAEEPLRVFIRGGVKTHGPNQHDHPRFLKEWKQLLTGRGMKADGAMSFPTEAQLESTDVLVVYAADGMNIVGQERDRFEKFLQRGGGLVVVHDGVVSADQQEWAKKVQGGAWIWQKNAPGRTATKWYEGEVGIYFLDTESPITKGISNFDWKDEIYYDLDMASDVQVLATSFHSVFVIAPQLWTYEKTWEGSSKPYRAFVSIPGHEFTSFDTPQYRTILLRGIAWAGRRQNVDEFCKSQELAGLAYPPGGPTPPEKAAQKIVTHPEFNIKLVASEPLIEKAISLDWDPQGRLWVAETPEYPNGRTINQNDKVIAKWAKENPSHIKDGKIDRPAKDRISWLEDTNGDGVMDKKHVFYEGLELVTSLVFYKDGVIVAQAPDILWIRDTDGDGKADKVEKLLTGFGTSDTHAVINNLRWGMDGWVYGAVGYSGGHPKSGDGKLDFGTIGSAIYRFKPDGRAFEVLASTACNTWGFDFGWDNEMYYSTPTCGDHALHIALPERILARGSVGNLRAQYRMQDHDRVKPLVHHTRPAYVQIDVVGGFTAAAGSCLYVGGAWPDKYNNTYFVSEPTVSLVHQDFLSPKGATFVASKEPGREESEFIAGTDLWFRPIHTRVGPDGALYVIDFYNQAVIHNDTRGPRHGANNAATRPDRDHHFARIWRVQHNQARELPKADFQSNKGLVAALEHPNGWARMTAQRLLFEKDDASTAPALAKLLRGSRSPAARIHALWALNDMGKLDEPRLLAAIADKDSAVRKNALRVVSENENNTGAGKLRAIQAQLGDKDDRVRLQALVALQTFTPTPAIAPSVVKAWPTLGGDPYLESAALGVSAREPVLFVQAALSAKAGAAHESFVRHVVRLLAQKGNANQVARLLQALAKAPPIADGQKQVALVSLNENLKQSVDIEWTSGLQSALTALLNSSNPSVSGAALPLVARWDKSGALSPTLKPIIAQLAAKLSDTTLPDVQRGQIAANLIGVRQIAPNAINEVVKILSAGNSAALQSRVIEALGTATEPAAGTALVTAFPSLAPELREAAFAQILKRSEWTRGLVQAIADKKVDLLTLGPASVHRLRTHPDRSVARQADEVITALRGPEQQQKDKVIAELLPVVEKPGNLENGKKMFTQNCLVCHTFKGQGRNLAPDLTGMGVHGPHELLVHIIDPNRVVEPNYVAINIETKDDNSYDGILSSENRTSVTLRNATGDIEIPKDNIRSRKSTGRSLMPEGFEALGGETLRDVIAFLSSDISRFRIVDLTPAFNADSTRGIYTSKETARDSVHFKRFGVVAAGPVPFEIVSPEKSASGNNLLVLKGGDGMARGYKQKVEVPVSNLQAAKLHLLGGIGGWAWPFGGEQSKGLPAAKISVLHADGQTETLTLSNGVHVVDYNNPSAECPGSKRADGIVKDGQIRTITFELKDKAPITRLTLESFNNAVATTFAAITAEGSDTTAVANK